MIDFGNNFININDIIVAEIRIPLHVLKVADIQYLHFYLKIFLLVSFVKCNMYVFPNVNYFKT